MAALVAHSTFQALPGFGQAARGLSHSSIMAPRWGSVTSVCVPSLMRDAGGVPATGPA